MSGPRAAHGIRSMSGAWFFEDMEDTVGTSKEVDLDALDKAHAATTPGEWEVEIPFPKFPDDQAMLLVHPHTLRLKFIAREAWRVLAEEVRGVLEGMPPSDAYVGYSPNAQQGLRNALSKVPR